MAWLSDAIEQLAPLVKLSLETPWDCLLETYRAMIDALTDQITRIEDRAGSLE